MSLAWTGYPGSHLSDGWWLQPYGKRWELHRFINGAWTVYGWYRTYESALAAHREATA